MNFKALLSIAIVPAIAGILPLRGQDAGVEADSLRYTFGRQPVESGHSTGTPYADTLDTGNPSVKVVLFNNGTFRFVRNHQALDTTAVYTEFWDEKITNPYRDEPDAIPDRFSIWLVDTLDSYCCPNQTKPFSKFGYRHGRRHQGIDLPYPTGTPVYAAFDGKVRISDWVGGYGNLIVIRHPNGLETFYGHLSRRDVQPGDWVNAGDVIALGGSTGRSTGPHLHFETRYRGAAFDPSWIIDFETGTLRHRMLKIREWYFNPSSRYVQSVDDEDEIYRSEEEDRLLAAEQEKKAAAEKAAAEAAAIRYHTIRSGDTLSGIAKKYHTSVKTLCRLNGITTTTTLQIGRRLRVN